MIEFIMTKSLSAVLKKIKLNKRGVSFSFFSSFFFLGGGSIFYFHSFIFFCLTYIHYIFPGVYKCKYTQWAQVHLNNVYLTFSANVK